MHGQGFAVDGHHVDLAIHHHGGCLSTTTPTNEVILLHAMTKHVEVLALLLRGMLLGLILLGYLQRITFHVIIE